MPAKTCQYGSCLEDVGERGIVVSLKMPTFNEERRAIYCCAVHAALSLWALARDRKEGETGEIPRRWRIT